MYNYVVSFYHNLYKYSTSIDEKSSNISDRSHRIMKGVHLMYNHVVKFHNNLYKLSTSIYKNNENILTDHLV